MPKTKDEPVDAEYITSDMMKAYPKTQHKFDVGGWAYLIHENSIRKFQVIQVQIIKQVQGIRIQYIFAGTPDRPWEQPAQIVRDEQDVWEDKKDLLNYIYGDLEREDHGNV